VALSLLPESLFRRRALAQPSVPPDG